ncbi:MAG: efflux RND transporter periplasmic adaptor subunit [Gemmatimonadaceae bacterium]|nr:efflux RND transporter periplasmic adaptor subunit [Gemmatimonadaceae bacterium]
MSRRIAEVLPAARTLTCAALLLATACSKSGDTAEARPAAGGEAAAKGGAPGAARGGGGPGAPGAGGGRGGVVLAATDVATLKSGVIENAVSVSGNLRPIETIEIRSRLNGDINAVLVQEGERVRAGQVLARFESSQQEAGRRGAEADRESARSQLQTATWAAEQSAALFKAGAIAEQEHRAAQQAVVAAQAAVAASEARLRTASAVAGDTRVLSPASGVIDLRQVQPGERVSISTPLFTLVKNETLELAANVPARQANLVRPGQAVRLTLDNRTIESRVARVSPTVDPVSRSVTVYVRVPNASGLIKGNTFVSGRVIGERLGNALLLPTGAIRQAQGTDAPPFVWRIAGGALEKRNVTLGVVDDGAGVAEVKEGLAAGDRVIVGNVGALGNGAKVTIAGGKS